jgi:hypothetical protein
MKTSYVVSLCALSITPAVAQVVTLECKGATAAGEKETHIVRYNEAAGWVKDNEVMTIRDGVSAESLQGLFVTIDRRTGKYVTFRPKSPEQTFRGSCEKMDRKF